MANFCKSCGAELKEGIKFCENCKTENSANDDRCRKCNIPLLK